MQINNWMVMLASFALVAGCDGGQGGYDDYAEEAAPMVSAESDASYAKGAPPPPTEPSPDKPPQGEEGGAMLAYSYSMGISAPKTAIEPMANAHQQACLDAGPSVCQVLGASVNRWGEDQVSANINLRATPTWLSDFRANIATDAENAGGRLTANTVSTEDLTRYIIDLDARLNAKITLRDRIRTLLETREGSLSDVLAAERELARVQGEIDSMTAQLAAARARVSMSTLNISYQTDVETSVGVFKPLREALGDFARTSVESLAETVRFIARAWPFFILALIVLAILRFWWRGRRTA